MQNRVFGSELTRRSEGFFRPIYPVIGQNRRGNTRTACPVCRDRANARGQASSTAGVHRRVFSRGYRLAFPGMQSRSLVSCADHPASPRRPKRLMFCGCHVCNPQYRVGSLPRTKERFI
jgi:hypothetical protein